MSKKCCPLRPEKVTNDDTQVVDDFGRCVGKDCAWYVETYEECALVSIAHMISDLDKQ